MLKQPMKKTTVAHKLDKAQVLDRMGTTLDNIYHNFQLAQDCARISDNDLQERLEFQNMLYYLLHVNDQ